MSKPYFTYGLATTKGTIRDVNEDTAIALTWSDVARFEGQNIGLFMVADGMGAADWGVRASRLAVQIVSQEIETSIFQPSDLSISQMMTAAVQKANLQVIADVSNGGTTLTAALLIGNQLHIAHVGDTRLYYIEAETITQMTTDHALMQRYIAAGSFRIDEETYAKAPMSKVLYRALGQSETVEVDFRSEQVARNSQLLLCSDGLISLDTSLTEADLLPVIANYEPQNACDQLIDLAQKHGSTDDITVIVVKVLQQ